MEKIPEYKIKPEKVSILYTFLKVFYCTGISFLESILQEFTFLKVQYVLLQKFTFIKRSLLEFTFFSSAV